MTRIFCDFIFSFEKIFSVFQFLNFRCRMGVDVLNVNVE